MSEVIQVFGGIEVAKKLAKRMMHLAWKAGRCLGMGFIQDRGPHMTEEQVWDAVVNRYDYGGIGKDTESQQVYADYVFGRMLKFGIVWSDRGVVSKGMPVWNPDYQSHCKIYPTFKDLARAAAKELELEISVLTPTTPTDA